MQISFNTDYCTGNGDYRTPLRLIAEAGFSHIMWCHHWNDDFVYFPSEISVIKQTLQEFNLAMLDLHASAGVEKCWFSEDENKRRAGAELVRNRIEMMDALGGTGAVIMHSPALRYREYFASDEEMEANTKLNIRRYDSLRRSIDELLPALEKYQVRLAVENTITETWEMIGRTLRDYPAEFIGLCYDSGHCNIKYNGLDDFANFVDRVFCTHLHDNDGTKDLHQPPFYGSIDWEKVASLIARAERVKVVNFEEIINNTPFFEADRPLNEQSEKAQKAFLQDAYERSAKIVRLIESKRLLSFHEKRK